MLQISGTPGGSVVRTQHLHCHNPGLIPGRGTYILGAIWCSQIKRKRRKEFQKEKESLIISCFTNRSKNTLSIRLSNIEVIGEFIGVNFIKV